MSRFEFEELPLAGLQLVTRIPIEDSRGRFVRLFCSNDLSCAGWKQSIVQINHAYTARKGTVRGLHFQHPPQSEMKIVSCLRGEVFDVAVDIRSNSSTFLNWHGEVLSAENQKAMLIPEGFAHGFQTLTDDVELLYFHSSAYSQELEGGLNPRDPKLSISWPLQISELSDRDTEQPTISSHFRGLIL